MDVVAELLVAGADPDLTSPAGIVAGDLAESHKRGQKIGKLLAAFRVEIEEQLGGGASPHPDEGQPSASVAAAAVTARKEVVARVASKRGLAIVEKALTGADKISRSASAACLDDKDDDEDSDIQLAGDAALEGEEARKMRKKKQEEKEAVRLQRVAERAAARRGVDIEGDRQKRLAEKIAARRAEDPEKRRLEKIAEKAAERRTKAATEEEARKKKEDAKLARLADKATDRSTARQVRAEQDVAAWNEAESDRKKLPVTKRKIVEDGVLACPSCGESTRRLTCGVCKMEGMCAVCSKCYLCGRTSGFAAKVGRHHVPGMVQTF